MDELICIGSINGQPIFITQEGWQKMKVYRIEVRLLPPQPPPEEKPEVGDTVEIVEACENNSFCNGRVGILKEIDNSDVPFRVVIHHGKYSYWACKVRVISKARPASEPKWSNKLLKFFKTLSVGQSYRLDGWVKRVGEEDFIIDGLSATTDMPPAPSTSSGQREPKTLREILRHWFGVTINAHGAGIDLKRRDSDVNSALQDVDRWLESLKGKLEVKTYWTSIEAGAYKNAVLSELQKQIRVEK